MLTAPKVAANEAHPSELFEAFKKSLAKQREKFITLEELLCGKTIAAKVNEHSRHYPDCLEMEKYLKKLQEITGADRVIDLFDTNDRGMMYLKQTIIDCINQIPSLAIQFYSKSVVSKKPDPNGSRVNLLDEFKNFLLSVNTQFLQPLMSFAENERIKKITTINNEDNLRLRQELLNKDGQLKEAEEEASRFSTELNKTQVWLQMERDTRVILAQKTQQENFQLECKLQELHQQQEINANIQLAINVTAPTAAVSTEHKSDLDEFPLETVANTAEAATQCDVGQNILGQNSFSAWYAFFGGAAATAAIVAAAAYLPRYIKR